MNVAELTYDRIRKTQDGNGISCNFVKMDESRGIKFYRDYAVRDNVMARQKLGAMYGLAPKVFETVDLPAIGYWGFVVELVGVAKFAMPEKYINQVKEIGPWRDRIEYTGNKEYFRVRDALISKAYEKLGFSMHDRHYNNLGFADDGRMVIIDWGTESVGEDRDDEEEEEEQSSVGSCQCRICHPSQFYSESCEDEEIEEVAGENPPF